MPRSSTYARTSRRGTTSSRKKKSNPPLKGNNLKKVNRERSKLGLAPVDKKKHSVFRNQISWSTYASGSTWSASDQLTSIPKGSVDDNYRLKDNIRVLPFTLKCRINQVVNTEHSYRVMIVRRPDMVTTMSAPQYTLRTFTDTTTCQLSSYTDASGRDDDNFQILYDKQFTMDSTNGMGRKFFNIKIKKNWQMEFDDASTTGTLAKGHLWFVCVTDAPAITGGYNYSIATTANFLDV